MKKGFTEQEKAYITANFRTVSNRDMAKALGCSKFKVQTFLKKNDLKLTKADLYFLRKCGARRRTFSEDEIRFIRQNAEKYSIEKLAKLLKATGSTVSEKLKEMGYGDLIRRRAKGSRFSSGHVPANKGKKMPEELKERVKHTFFQKGQAPVNYLPVGSERFTTDNYLRVKIADPDVWEFKHILVWEKHYGPVREGMIITFKDGDFTNCDIDNLEMISQAENLHRNRFSIRREWDVSQARRAVATQIRNLKILENGKK